MRRFDVAALGEDAPREVSVELRRERQITDVDSLVGAVNQGRAVEQRLVTLGEEAVGDALREGDPEVAGGGGAREHPPPPPPAPGLLPAPPRGRVHQGARPPRPGAARPPRGDPRPALRPPPPPP